MPASLLIVLRSEVHDAKTNEAHGAMNKERHVCACRRGGEPAVSPGEAAASLSSESRVHERRETVHDHASSLAR